VKRSILLAAASASLLLVLTACVSSGTSSTPSATEIPGDDTETARPTTTQVLSVFPASAELDEWCPRDVDAVHLHQPAAEVVDSFVCTIGVDAADMTTVTVNKVTGGLDELLTAYSELDALVDPDGSCTQPIVDPLAVWLSYPGERSYPVYAPVGPCGFPTDEAKAAFTALELTPVVSFTATPDGITTTDIGLGTPGAPAKETT
jgi:hypothetical protein